MSLTAFTCYSLLVNSAPTTPHARALQINSSPKTFKCSCRFYDLRSSRLRVENELMQIPKTYRTFLTRACAVGMSVVLSAGAPYLSSVAQRKSKEKPPVVTGITSRKVANGEVISLSADRDLNGIQTWQDPNGSFHLILPGSGEHSITSSPNGVKVRRVGNSLEIEVRAKRGSSVTVTPQLNSLDLVVTGGVESSANSFGDEAIRPWTPSVRREAISRSTRATRNGPAMDR